MKYSRCLLLAGGASATVLLVLAALAWPWGQVEARIACDQTGSAESQINMLILGDSWANGLLDKGMIAVADSRKLSIKVCKIGYAGLIASRIGESVRRDGSVAKIVAGEFGGRLDVLIIVNGVNDAGRHVGAGNYARANADLVAMVQPQRRSFILELPHFSQDGASTVLAGYLLRRMRSCVFDGCRWEVEKEYRQQMVKLRGPSEILSFDRFVVCHAISPRDYANATHLRRDRLVDLGRYIGAQVMQRIVGPAPGDSGGCGLMVPAPAE